MSYTLIFCIVPRGQGELVTSSANKAGAGGGTIIMGKGTASNGIIQLLGFGDSSKDIAYILVTDEKKREVIDAIKIATETKKSHFGVLWTLNVSQFIKCGQITGGKIMGENAPHQMITVIVNKGYAEDAMDAARKAGAGGGTIINARGTAKEGDAKFFGMEIVPEKEMLLILVPTEKSNEVVEAIRALPCLATPGSGISFCSDAHDFSLLGAK